MDIYRSVFIAGLFTTTKTLHQPKWHQHMTREDVLIVFMEYYSDIEKNEIVPFGIKWMDFL